MGKKVHGLILCLALLLSIPLLAFAANQVNTIEIPLPRQAQPTMGMIDYDAACIANYKYLKFEDVYPAIKIVIIDCEVSGFFEWCIKKSL